MADTETSGTWERSVPLQKICMKNSANIQSKTQNVDEQDDVQEELGHDTSKHDKITLYKVIARRESRLILPIFLSEIKQSQVFNEFVQRFQKLDRKMQGLELQHIARMFDKGSLNDRMFMFLIEACYTANCVIGDVTKYGHCLKQLEKIKGCFSFHDERHMDFWLARQKSICYIIKRKPVVALKDVHKVLEEFYETDAYKPDMWKAFACRQLGKHKLYQEYLGQWMRSKNSPDACGTAYSPNHQQALQLLEDECASAACDPCLSPGNYFNLCSHVQKLLLALNIPLEFLLLVQKSRSHVSGQLRYVDLPAEFTRFFEPKNNSSDRARCQGYLESLKRLKSLNRTPLVGKEDNYLPRMIFLTEIGMCAMEFSDPPSSLPVLINKLVNICQHMVQYIREFSVFHQVYPRQYRFARPDTIFPVFIIFLKRILQDIPSVYTFRYTMQSLVSETCQMPFTMESLFQFSENLDGFRNIFTQAEKGQVNVELDGNIGKEKEEPSASNLSNLDDVAATASSEESSNI